MLLRFEHRAPGYHEAPELRWLNPGVVKSKLRCLSTLVGFVGVDDIAVVIAFVKTKKRWYEPEIHILCNSGSSAAVDCRCGVLVRPRHRWLRIGNWSQIDIPRAPPRTIDPRIVRQMPLADASSQIYELWQREGLQGFTGMRIDNDKGEVILYWKGQVPHRMVALVRTLRTSVPVRVVERPCSLVELQREARRLVELDLSGAGFQCHSGRTQHSMPRPTKLYKIKNIRIEIQLGSVGSTGDSLRQYQDSIGNRV